MMKKVSLLKLLCTSVLLAGFIFNANAAGKTGTPLTIDPAVKQGTLSNGMNYLVQKNAMPANRIVLRLVVKAGSCMEEENQRGVAHFIEHLAFNGTENFEKNEIVNYFERIGMNFGADLNAYTSWEETVYMLEVPADDPKMLETAMLILHDWACGVTFPQEEIDKERGVVTEEWRLRQGLQGRLSDAEIPFFLKDSVFENRLPIGNMDVIKNVTRDEILSFYKKWYRPELMTVVAVGDAETSVLEAAVKKAMSVIPASDVKFESKHLETPVRKEKALLTLKDAEMPYTNVIIMNQQENFAPRATEEDIQKLIAVQMAATIFNNRLNEISTSASSPWLGAYVNEEGLTNWTIEDELIVVPKTGMFEAAMKAFFDEYDRFMDFGVTEAEFNRAVQAQLSGAESDYKNKDNILSSDFAQTLVTYAICGKIPVSVDAMYKICKKVIPQITIEQINQVSKEALGNRGKMMMVIAPQSENLPSDKEIMSIWKDYKSAEIAAYEDNVSDDNLMPKPAAKAKVVSKKSIKALGAKEYVLENGIKIITKKTDFEKDVIYSNISSKGGYFYVDEQNVKSVKRGVNYAILSGFTDLSYNDLIKKIGTKKISLSMGIELTDEYLDGSCRTEDLESYLQLVNLLFSDVQFKADAWNVVMQNAAEEARAHGSTPTDEFNDKIHEILYGKGDVYHSSFTNEDLALLNAAAAEKGYRERFANPADFTYVFVGDFNEKTLLEMCCYYLGNLKTTADREETVYKYWKFPEGITAATVKKGLDEQGYVKIIFGGELPPEADVEKSYEESVILNQLEALLDIRLREVIREDKSGSYGVGVDAFIDGYPERYYRVTVSFGCEPNRAEELTAEVINQIKQLQTQVVDADYIGKLKETNRRNRETNLYKNDWWLNRINAELVFTYEPTWVTSDKNKIDSFITAENLQAAANKYLNTENYISVFLKPEK